jgi:lsr operon transcriptional repressor
MDEHLNKTMLAKIAWLYYYENLSQQEISDLVGMPRIKIVRLLKVIREQNIVEIKISKEYISLFDIEKELKDLSGLSDLMVVPTGHDPKSSVTYAASLKFAGFCETYESIGVGSSRIVAAALEALEPPRRKKVQRIVSLTGNTMPNYAVNPSNPCSSGIMLARLLGVDYFNIWAPSIAPTKDIAQLVKSDYVMASILKMANSVECAMVGLGDVKDTVLYSRGFITDKEVSALMESGAAGDLLTHFYDIDGKRISTAIEDRSVTADVPMKCPVTAVAYGANKVLPIVGAIRGRYISGLITDEDTAAAVLSALKGR